MKISAENSSSPARSLQLLKDRRVVVIGVGHGGGQGNIRLLQPGIQGGKLLFPGHTGAQVNGTQTVEGELPAVGIRKSRDGGGQLPTEGACQGGSGGKQGNLQGKYGFFIELQQIGEEFLLLVRKFFAQFAQGVLLL